MLERIEQLMAGLREVSDSIAHDLKTPLNRLRNRAEAALVDGRGSEGWKVGLERVIELRRQFGDTPIRLLQTTRLERIKGTPEQRAEFLARHGIDGINLHRTDWNGGLVALFHRFGLITFGWDMQHEHELRDGLRMGLDAVYSDHVDRMIDAFREEIGNPLG